MATEEHGAQTEGGVGEEVMKALTYLPAIVHLFFLHLMG